MDAFFAEAKLKEVDVLIWRKIKFIRGFRHFLPAVDFGHLDAIQVVCETEPLNVRIAHEYLNLIYMKVLRLAEEQLVIESVFAVLSHLLFCEEGARTMGSASSVETAPQDLHELHIVLIEGLHGSLSATHSLLFDKFVAA